MSIIKVFKKFVLLQIVLLAGLAAHGQNLFFKNLTINDGLPSNYINCVSQDKTGYMWIATNDGLCRYDGYNFKVFHSLANDTASLLDDDCGTIFIDSQNNLWCFHNRKGVSCFNIQTGKTKRFTFSKILGKSFYSFCASISEHNGVIYVPIFGDPKGILLFDLNGNYKGISHLSDLKGSEKLLSNNVGVFQIYFCSEDSVYLGTTNGLILFNPQQNKIIEVYNFCKTLKGDNDCYVSNIYNENDSILWLGSWSAGIIRFNRFAKTAKLFNDAILNGKAENVRSAKMIAKKSDHEYWITGWDLKVLNAQTGITTIKQKDESDISSKAYVSFILDGCVTNTGSIWFYGRGGGIYIYEKSNQLFFNYNFPPLISSLFGEVLQNVLYNKHVSKYIITSHVDGKPSSSYVTILNDNKELVSRYKTNVPLYLTADCIDSNNTTWLASDTLLFQLDKNFQLQKTNFNTSHYKFKTDESISNIFPFGDFLLLQCYRAQNVYLYSVSQKTLQTISLKDLTKNIPEINFFSATIDKGKIWMASSEGIMMLDTSNFKLTQFDRINLFKKYGEKEVTQLFFDSQQRLWFTLLKNGLFCYDFKKDTLIHFGLNEGLLSQNILDAQMDEYDIIWMRISKGLSTFNTKTSEEKLYDYHSGLPATIRGLFKMKPDEMYYIIDNGFGYFSPPGLKVQNEKAKVVINSFRILNEEFQLYISNYDSLKVTVDYKHNFFSFDFSLLNFSNSSLNTYTYMLEGLDSGWNYSSTRNFASYSDLAPGKYIFKVKAANPDGVWSDKIASIQITIEPPFWKTFWFKILIIALIVLLIYLFYRMKINRVKEREALKSDYNKKVAEVEMSALRAQMNPHFIFNCLNAINRYVVRSDKITASDYITKFSQLIRLVLENSRSNLVSLQKELEALDLYIQMEALRFENKFNYSITVDKSIEQDFIEVPPLLIQPYVENAIWHGLMHKTEKGNLYVKIELHSGVLKCIIEDDGIGRAKATELKSKSATHKSHGMKVTSERLDIINTLYHIHSTVEVIDMKDENGNAAGTKVVLSIPMNI